MTQNACCERLLMKITHLAKGLIALMAGSSQRVMVHCKIPPRTDVLRLSGWSKPAWKVTLSLFTGEMAAALHTSCLRRGCQVPDTEYTASSALMAKGSCTVLRSSVLNTLVGMGTSLRA